MKTTIAVLLLSLLRRTWRLRIIGQVPQRGIIAFWHGEMLPVWALLAGQDAVALVSPSRDGAVLAALLECWGYRCVRGSSSRGGKSALEQLIEHARAGRLVLITPDGPRGPRGQIKRGAVLCAQHAGVPLFWCRVRCRWAWFFRRSWDHFMLPLPFSRVTVDISQPISIPHDATDEDLARFRHELAERFAPSV
ncbi:MAG: lysophospholipid acyltransferase family protein [Chlorobi bacterium]|nr:lysophospholipid acyltransferase family protein [Chlorobiota bacterium]